MATLAFIQGSVYFTEKVLENQLNLPTWVSGACSGVVHSVLISPVDLTKIQMQVQGVKGIQNIKVGLIFFCFYDLSKTKTTNSFFRPQRDKIQVFVFQVCTYSNLYNINIS